ncbi:MAG: EscR/YscR/HrcR family type III secretion system export apparatus protein, partial [Deltaproteobacteria bacterium]|nr:EscR/YscR/HrcR family type III secretion system export apparatus protein [Deltaproteobacteria bacterium]
MGPSPVLTVMILTGLGVAAAAFLMVSSFVKIAVVLSILRSAIGLQQIPPASVITGLALILS